MKPGSLAFIDLTVADAAPLRDFYASVIGWSVTSCDMGGYEDYGLGPAGQDAVVGVCHARGPNAAIPPHWLPYFVVADLDASLADATSRGGALLSGPRPLGEGRFAVLRDPAGAIFALWSA